MHSKIQIDKKEAIIFDINLSDTYKGYVFSRIQIESAQQIFYLIGRSIIIEDNNSNEIRYIAELFPIQPHSCLNVLLILNKV